MDEEETEEMRRRHQEKRTKKPPEHEDDDERQETVGGEDKNTSETVCKNKTKAVLFVPYTHGSVMAKRLREAEENMLETTGYKLKIVERGGSKLEDLLHRSDPSQGQDCERQGCLLCSTKLKTGKNTSQDCSKRNLVYKTYCITCRNRDTEKIEQEFGQDKKRLKEELGKMRLHLYVGETSRSSFERGQEHQKDMRQLKPASNILRHALDQHEGETLSSIEFGMEVVR